MKKPACQRAFSDFGLSGHSDHRTEVCPHAIQISRTDRMENPRGITFRQYQKNLWKQFRGDVRHDVFGIVITIVLIIITAFLQSRFGLLQTDKTFLSVAINVGPYVAFLICFLVYHYIRAPWRLAQSWNIEREAEAEGFKKQIDQLTPPKRSPEQDKKLAEVKAAANEIGTEALMVLRHLETHVKIMFRTSLGSSTPEPHAASQLPEGMDSRRTRSCLERCANKQLVSHFQETITSGGIYPITQDTYSIAEGMRDAVRELLFPAPVP